MVSSFKLQAGMARQSHASMSPSGYKSGLTDISSAQSTHQVSADDAQAPLPRDLPLLTAYVTLLRSDAIGPDW
jgi:hypothetical protein